MLSGDRLAGCFTATADFNGTEGFAVDPADAIPVGGTNQADSLPVVKPSRIPANAMAIAPRMRLSIMLFPEAMLRLHVQNHTVPTRFRSARAIWTAR